MSYPHFGRIGDVWKHLPLGEILKIEKPRIYVETNSAHPQYKVIDDWRVDYGINWFLKNAGGMANTEYFRIESAALKKSKYLGSPALAMSILGNTCQEYHLFDIENDALAENKIFAESFFLNDKMFTHNTDSRTGLLEIFPKLTDNDFIHFDPYMLFDANEEGHCYSDLFKKSLEKNIKSLLWYGFGSSQEKTKINKWAEGIISSFGQDKVKLYEIEIADFEELPLSLNPGVGGCGIIVVNLSPQSFDTVENLFEYTLRIYVDVEVINGHHFKTNGFKI
jgi:23S rRNA (adenine2030-N6)-methyltransferase